MAGGYSFNEIKIKSAFLGVTEAVVVVGALVPEEAQEEGSGPLYHISHLTSICVKWPSPGSSQHLMKPPSVRPC